MFNQMKSFNFEKKEVVEEEKEKVVEEEETAPLNSIDINDPEGMKRNKPKANARFFIVVGIAVAIIATMLFIFFRSKGPSNLSPSLQVSNLDLKIGDTAQIKSNLSVNEYKKLSWISNDSKVATVKDGLVTAVSVGDAIIRATYPKGQSQTVSISVTSDLLPFAVKEDKMLLQKGELKEILVTGAVSSELTWISAYPKVASVNNGVVKAHHVGKTTIVVKKEDGEKLTVFVEVEGDEEELESFTIEAIRNISVGDTKQIVINTMPEGALKLFTFTSNDESIATVSQSGLITAISTGETSIKVTSYNGVESAILIKIY